MSDLPGVYCNVDVLVLYRRHPLINATGLTDRELLDYLALWAMAVEFRREKLPEPYTDTPKGWRKIAKNVGSDPRVVRKMVAKSQQKCPVKSLLTIDRRNGRNRITVNGVIAKHGRFKFKDDKKVAKVSRQTSMNLPSKGRQHNITEHNKAKQRRRLKPFQCPPDLIPLQEKLRQINLKNFDHTTFDANYVKMIDAAVNVLSRDGTRASGIAVISIEINCMETWLENQIDIGKIKRDANHGVRMRFTNWLRTTHKIKREQDQQPPPFRSFDRERDPYKKSEPTELGNVLNQIKEKAKDAKKN